MKVSPIWMHKISIYLFLESLQSSICLPSLSMLMTNLWNPNLGSPNTTPSKCWRHSLVGDISEGNWTGTQEAIYYLSICCSCCLTSQPSQEQKVALQHGPGRAEVPPEDPSRRKGRDDRPRRGLLLFLSSKTLSDSEVFLLHSLLHPLQWRLSGTTFLCQAPSRGFTKDILQRGDLSESSLSCHR